MLATSLAPDGYTTFRHAAHARVSGRRNAYRPGHAEDPPALRHHPAGVVGDDALPVRDAPALADDPGAGDDPAFPYRHEVVRVEADRHHGEPGTNRGEQRLRDRQRHRVRSRFAEREHLVEERPVGARHRSSVRSGCSPPRRMIFCLVRMRSSRGTRVRYAVQRAISVASSSGGTTADTSRSESASAASTSLPVRASSRATRSADEIVERAVDDVAERDLGMRERGGRRRDAEVAEDGEVESSRERGAVDGGQRRQRASEQRVVEAVARIPQARGPGGIGEELEFAEIEPSGEDVPGTRDHDRLDVLVAGERLDGVAHLVAERDRERVLPLGAGEHDGCDAGVVGADANVLGHALGMRSAWRSHKRLR